jgi:alpha-tubulin suppressor-like RCC1 family protein
VFVRNGTDTGVLGGVGQIEGGGHQTCARLASGQARCWGWNAAGGLGDSDSPNNSELPVVVRNPVDTGPLTEVTQVSSDGSNSSCARLNSGQLRCWGFNAFGQLGNGTDANRDVPVVVQSG